MKKFAEVAHYYLGTGLEIQYNFETKTNGIEIREGKLHGLNYPYYTMEVLIETLYNDVVKVDSRKLKPHFRPLSSLTKPITVKGYNDDEPFIPLAIILATYLRMDKIHSQKIQYTDVIVLFKFVEELPLWIVKLLLSWHINIFNLEETEYIKIES